jgi:hypothetical protein
MPALAMRYITLSVLFLCPACFDLHPPPLPDAGPDDSPSIRELRVLDASGREREPGAIPRAPILRIESSAPLEGDPQPFLLLDGDADADLLEDLRTAPARSTTLAREVDCEVTREASTVLLRPRAALEPGAHLVLAVAGWAGDADGRHIAAPYLRELRVADDDASGARAVESWPPDGASGLGTTIPIVAVRFDGAVTGIETDLWLEDTSGARVPAVVRAALCAEIGWTGPQCAAIVLDRPLAPLTAHSIHVGPELRDATGAPIPPWTSRFWTGAEPDTTPPVFTTTTCAIDEEAIEAGCALADDERIALRLRGREAMRLRIDAAGRRYSLVATRGEADLEIPDLPPATAVPVVVMAFDASGNRTELTLTLATEPPLATVALSEVLANPYAAEPRQEWIEVANFGPAAIDLEGFALADSTSSEGDPIEGSHVVPPGARVLLVPLDFDPTDRGPDRLDPAIPPGVALVRIDRSLAAGGLSNAGEPLFLRDAEGRRLSAVPGWPPPREGICATRVAASGRTGALGSFDYDPHGCTPGR